MRNNSKKDIVLHFKGHLGLDGISDLIHVLKERMKARQVNFVTYKKVLILMIESLENILRYNNQLDRRTNIPKDYPPNFQIYTENEGFVIESSNAILNEDIPELDDRLNYLNNLNRTSIKDLYKSTITDGKFSDKGGAGLGIIEMAKISDEKLEFSFSPINNLFSYFSLRLLVLNTANLEKSTNE
jgi:hypothetical protein